LLEPEPEVDKKVAKKVDNEEVDNEEADNAELDK
jgi:hypothetical protein